MPYDDYDTEDPLELVGCEVELEEEHLTEMAECFVEEFARMGAGANQLLELFRNPFYRGPHSVFERRGEAWVKDLIEARLGVRPDAPPAGLVALEPLPAGSKE